MRKRKATALQALAEQVELANTTLAQHRLCETERLYRQIIAQAPRIPEVRNNLGTVLKEQGRLGEAQAVFELALELRPDYVSAYSNLLFTLQYAPEQTLAGLRVAHEDWARQQLQGITPADLASFACKDGGPLVVGLVSPDLYAHPVATFVQHGIDATRIDCRSWSSHPQMLVEYCEIDIALDPFPFSGGLTSCDALHMGVPVLTLPGELPISRQTGSFLDVLGLSNWIAVSVEDYIATVELICWGTYARACEKRCLPADFAMAPPIQEPLSQPCRR